jgi:predicted aldo/keto reductase-like oxidoreductase
MGVLTWAEGAISDGRIKHLGFSFHDDYDVFKGIVDDYDRWTLCQIQYNFMDTEYQAGTEGLQYAAEKGLAVVIMEPIRGGQLSKRPPDDVASLYGSASIQRSPAEWALQWIWNQPEVSTVLSGMTAMDHVIENVEAADRSGPDTLAEDELSLIKQVEEEYRKRSPIPCTLCNYCLPCPNNVRIPGVFGLYNDAIMYGDSQRARFLYTIRIQQDERAEHCEECNECEEKCPQEIPVAEWMKKVQELLE